MRRVARQTRMIMTGTMSAVRLGHERAFARSVLAAIFTLCSCCAGAGFSVAKAQSVGVLEKFDRQSPDQRFIGGLRRRGLYDLGRRYCEQQLAGDELDIKSQSEIIVEWIKLDVAAAVDAPSAAQDQAWRLAEKTAEESLATWGNGPRRILIELQSALTLLSRGIKTNREYLARGDQLPADEIQTALSALRNSIDLLQDVRQSAAQLKAQRIREPSRNTAALNVDQLDSLEKSVLQYLAEANFRRALFYPQADRKSRIDALTQVLTQVQELESQINREHDLWIPTRLLRARCQRLLGDLPNASSTLNELRLSVGLGRGDYRVAIPLSSLDKNAAAWAHEAIQLSLLRGPIDSWIEQLAGLLQQDFRCHADSPELDISMVQLCLAQSVGSKNEQEKLLWQEHAVQIADQISSQLGRYWGRLADLQLVDVARADTNSSSVGVLMRLAEQYIQKRQYSEALETLETIGNVAVKEKRDDLALQAGFRAGQIWQQQREFAEAADQMRLAALRYADEAQSPNVHLLACWNQAQHLRSMAGENGKESETLDSYVSLLREHLITWPAASTSGQARMWAARASWVDGQSADCALHYLLVLTSTDAELDSRIQAGSWLAGNLVVAIADSAETDTPQTDTPQTEAELAAQQELMRELFGGLGINDMDAAVEKISSVVDEAGTPPQLVACLLMATCQFELSPLCRTGSNENQVDPEQISSTMRRLAKTNLQLQSALADSEPGTVELNLQLARATAFWLLVGSAALNNGDDWERELSAWVDNLKLGDPLRTHQQLNNFLVALNHLDTEYSVAELSRLKSLVANQIASSTFASGIQLPRKDMANWQALLDETMVKIGEPRETYQYFAAKAATEPKNFGVQLEFARSGSNLLAAGLANTDGSFSTEDRDLAIESLSLWRKISQASKQDSSVWFESKFRVAWTLYHSGDKEQAGKILRYIQATNNQRKNDPWRKRMDQLLNKILDN